MNFLADYSRQISLDAMSEEKQALMINSQALVFGAGGLGVAAISYLSAAGVGAITIVDFDCIEASNLHRQTIYRVADIGAYKAEVAASYISERNPNCDISAITVCLDAQSIYQLCEQHNIVLDCTDDQAFSRVLNAVCLFTKKKAVFANAIKLEGQLFVFSPEANQPCFNCLWPEGQSSSDSCGQVGVLGPVPGALGCLQALEAIKLLTEQQSPLQGHLLHCDFTTYEFSRIKVPKADSCNHQSSAVQIEEAYNSYLINKIPILDQSISQNNVLIDIRSLDEVNHITLDFPTQHIEGHKLAANPDYFLDYQTKYMLICASGKRSKTLSDQLQKTGYQVAPCRLN
jgi:molybdopterin/thiamine biosynthesis adenylyltransferase